MAFATILFTVIYQPYTVAFATTMLKKNGLYESADSSVKAIHFAGLKPACDKIEAEYSGRIKTFRGGESAGFLDILSIGSSQLSQSSFGESWEGKPNGGGVPVNSEEEYHAIWQASRPMLVRTYSSTKDVAKNAAVYERSINICWQ